MSDPVEVSLEFTPNPNTLKFVVNRQLLDRGAANFPSLESAAKSPLALKLFEIPGIGALMIGRNFVTVTKTDSGEWDKIHQACTVVIPQFLESGAKIIEGDISESPVNHHMASGEIEEKIKQILDNEIRPAVAMDGGDITFDKYENGVVYLLLQGSCSGCPSSTMTLKMGIESRLREVIPEIKEVVSI